MKELTNTQKIDQANHELVTHCNPHIDELVGMYLELREGTTNYQSLRFTSSNLNLKKQFEDLNITGIGIGNGEHDEHKVDGKGSDADSAVITIAQKLNLTKDPRYSGMVNYAHTNDSKGATISGELGTLITQMYYQGKSEEEVMKWVFEILDRDVALSNRSKERKSFLRQQRGNMLSCSEMETILDTFNHTDKKVKRFVLPGSFTINDVAAVKLAQTFGFNLFNTNSHTRAIFVNPFTYEPKEDDLCIGFGQDGFAHLSMEKMVKVLRLPKNHNYTLVYEYIHGINSRSGYHPYELASLLSDRIFEKNMGVGNSKTFCGQLML